VALRWITLLEKATDGCRVSRRLAKTTCNAWGGDAGVMPTRRLSLSLVRASRCCALGDCDMVEATEKTTHRLMACEVHGAQILIGMKPRDHCSVCARRRSRTCDSVVIRGEYREEPFSLVTPLVSDPGKAVPRGS
jgi:hypothetical protein